MTIDKTINSISVKMYHRTYAEHFNNTLQARQLQGKNVNRFGRQFRSVDPRERYASKRPRDNHIKVHIRSGDIDKSPE